MDDFDNNRAVKIPNAVLESNSRISPVWILPIITLLVGGWLVYKSFSEKGPVVTVSFNNASGIETGKTTVKYRDINVGLVSAVDFSEDLSHINVTIQMNAKVDEWLTESTRFWVVKPRIGVSGISGLGTLVSGTYIALDPGKMQNADFTTQFIGLEQPPGVESDATGTMYKLLGSELGSISIGSIVLYRQIKVGKVINYRLTDNHRNVEIDIFINAPHDEFVKNNSHFWNASGVEMDLDANGIKFDVEALSTLLMGGISFDTPANFLDTEQARPGTVFSLSKSNEQLQNQLVAAGLPYLLYFEDTVRGLSEGAPVEFRGIRVGTVSQISMDTDVEQDRVRVPVLIEIEPMRIPQFQNVPEEDTNSHFENIKSMINRLVVKGLRARLQTGNLMTGQLFVELGLFGEAGTEKIELEGVFPVMPTAAGTLNNIEERISDILTSIEQIPLDKIGKNLESSSAGINRLVNEDGLYTSVANLNTTLSELKKLVSELNTSSGPVLKSSQQTLNQAVKTLAAFENVASENGPMGRQLANTLEELSSAARSIRIMAEYLERHPEALLKGKNSSQ